MNTPWEVVIVGAGPAGCALALALAQQAPGLTPKVLVVEKAVHPREKPCGGGVTIIGERVLRALGLPWDTLRVPSVPVHHMRLVYDGLAFTWDIPYIFRVFRRPRFDAALLNHVRERGIAVWEGVAVQGLERKGTTWEVVTSRGTIQARVVVGADGAKSTVRKAAGFPRSRRVSRLVECFMALDDPTAREVWREHRAVFDFTPMRVGVQGYVWDFPVVEGEEPRVNRGVFDSRVWSQRPRANLKDVFAAALRERGVSSAACPLVGHPERWYAPDDVYGLPGVVLVGEAAGIDPLLGEGISFALWYGLTVAPWLVDALDTGDLTFRDYSRRLRESPLGRHLALRVRLARFAYARGHRFVRFWWLWLGRFLQAYRRLVLRDMRREGLGLPGPLDVQNNAGVSPVHAGQRPGQGEKVQPEGARLHRA